MPGTRRKPPTATTAPARGVTPSLEIAWARAVSRAADDPAFRQQLEQDPAAALAEFGVEVPEDVDLARDLTPSLAAALSSIERQRTLLAAAGVPTACTGAYGGSQQQGGEGGGQADAQGGRWTGSTGGQTYAPQGQSGGAGFDQGRWIESCLGSAATGCGCSACSGTSGTFGTAGCLGSVGGTAGSAATVGSFGSAGQAGQVNCYGGGLQGGGPQGGQWTGATGGQTYPFQGQTGGTGFQQGRWIENCWGSAACIGSLGTFGGTAGTVGTAGSYGCAGQEAIPGGAPTMGGTTGSFGTFGGGNGPGGGPFTAPNTFACRGCGGCATGMASAGPGATAGGPGGYCQPPVRLGGPPSGATQSGWGQTSCYPCSQPSYCTAG